MNPTFQELKYALREVNPKITCQQCKDIYEMVYGTGTLIKALEEYVIADTEVCKTNLVCNRADQKEVENTMSYDEISCVPCAPRLKARTVMAPMANAQVISQPTVEASQRDYAIERIKAIGEKHARALRVQFNMDADRQPETFNELKAAFDSGNYVVDKEKTDSEFAGHYSIFYGVKWGKPADKAGYEAAKAILQDDAQKFLDVVTLKTIDDALKAIGDFEAWTLPQS